MQEKEKEARERTLNAHESKKQEIYSARRDLVLKLKDARRQDVCDTMQRQFNQGLGGPDWDAIDYTWRPTWMPGQLARPSP